MKINSYLCFVLGEQSERAARLHNSSITRLKAFAIAIHIPIALWAVTGFIIASQVFHLDNEHAGAIALFCALLIYMVERLVLASPKGMGVNILRIFIGFLMAVLGASAVDLVIFEREVAQQLREVGEARIKSEYDLSIAKQIDATGLAKADWVRSQEAANCEANGTCGSKIRSLGPVYQQLSRQATILRAEYLTTAEKVDVLKSEKARAITEFKASSTALDQARSRFGHRHCWQDAGYRDTHRMPRMNTTQRAGLLQRWSVVQEELIPGIPAESLIRQPDTLQAT